MLGIGPCFVPEQVLMPGEALREGSCSGGNTVMRADDGGQRLGGPAFPTVYLSEPALKDLLPGQGVRQGRAWRELFQLIRGMLNEERA